MNLLALIEEAFAFRQAPLVVVKDHHPPTDEYEDAKAFQGKQWQEITCADLDQHFAAVHGFSPAAFCYFLPGIFSAGIREGRPDLLVNDSLVTTLDRGNAPSSWDDFFKARWPMLSSKECEATQNWLLWLAEADPPVISDASLSRAYDTLAVLANKDQATPLAGWVSSHKRT